MLQHRAAQTYERVGLSVQAASAMMHNESYEEGEIMHSHFQMSCK